jgi:hypothetical protein
MPNYLVLRKFLPIGILTIAFLLLSYKITSLINDPNFIYLHDEFLVLSEAESKNLFYVHLPDDLGISNTTSMLVTIFSRIVYYFLYSIGLNNFQAQKVYYVINSFIAVFLPYIGVRALYQKLSPRHGRHIDDILILVLSLWYSFNTFTIIHWHANGFSMTPLVCYSLAPLCYYHLLSIYSNKSVSIRHYAISALSILAMSFTVFFSPIFVGICLFTLPYFAYRNKLTIIDFIKRSAILAIITAPLLLIFTFIPYNNRNIEPTVNLTGGATFGIQNGGILSPLMMWYSWGIYSDWFPRNIFTFNQYFTSTPYLLLSLPLILLLIYGIYKTQSKLYSYFFLMLLGILVIAKGSQPPFGELYLYFLNSFYLFRIFRSPDSKLGFGFVLVTVILITLLSKKISKRLTTFIVLLAFLVQSYPLFFGPVIEGQNTEYSSDRVINIPAEYHELIEILADKSSHYDYILSLPSVEFGHFLLSNDEKHLGADLIPKISGHPSIYISEFSAMSVETYAILREAVNSGDFDTLNEFPIRYYLARYDNQFDKPADEVISNFESNYNKLLENNLLTLYQNTDAPNMVTGDIIEYYQISPVKYSIKLDTSTNRAKTIILNESFNTNWRLYTKQSKNIFEDLTFLISDDNSEYQIPKQDLYRNKWIIPYDETSTSEITLYYKPQIIFYLSSIIVLVYASILIGIIVVRKENDIK